MKAVFFTITTISLAQTAFAVALPEIGIGSSMVEVAAREAAPIAEADWSYLSKKTESVNVEKRNDDKALVPVNKNTEVAKTEPGGTQGQGTQRKGEIISVEEIEEDPAVEAAEEAAEEKKTGKKLTKEEKAARKAEKAKQKQKCDNCVMNKRLAKISITAPEAFAQCGKKEGDPCYGLKLRINK